MELDFLTQLLPAFGVFTTIAFLAIFIYSYIIRRRESLYSRKDIVNMSYQRDKYEKMIDQLTREMTRQTRMWEDANHLLNNKINYSPIEQANIQVENNSPIIDSKLFFERHGLDISKMSIDKKSVFVLIPFLDDYRNTYQTINSVCSDYGLNCSMGDEEFIKGDILPHILGKIIKARLVIACIDGRNPNVFYELGIAHALGKPTILISNSEGINETPIDVTSKYITFYGSQESLKNRLRESMNKLLLFNT